MLRLAKRVFCGPMAVMCLALAPSAAAAPGDIATVAGTGLAGFGGDDTAATLAQLNAATAIAPLSDGGFLIADYKNNRIRQVSSSGLITTVAGTGTAGVAGDSGPATAAQLAAPVGVAALADGGFLIADSASNRIRRVSNSGVITTVAGTGAAGASGDAGAATAATLNGPTDVHPTADGGFLIADYKNNRIRKVSSSGVISTVAGTNGPPGFSGDDGAATAAQLNAPVSVRPLADGGFLIADSGNNRIRRDSSAGLITTVAGTGTAGFSGDGGAATAAQLNAPVGVEPTPDGGFVVADMTNNRIRAVAADGTITTIAGTGAPAFAGDGGAATAAALNAPVGVALAATGATLIADSGNNRIRSIEAPAPAPAADPLPSPTETIATPTEPTVAPAAPSPAPPADEPKPLLALLRLPELGLVAPRGGVTVTRQGVVPLPINCSARASATCRGTVTLVVTVRSARRASIARRATIKIAKAKFSVAPGKKATVKARLTRRGRQLLAKKGKLRVTAKISRRGGPNLGDKSSATAITIKSSKRGKSSKRRRVKKAAVEGGLR